ncbi:MAG TPA: iron-containing alcohol dehydrogenase [Thermoanaerobaculia bacterium]|nr:iron-containing alcohol dehydrogenase [Thermoanaerobaculia bacterium]
MSEGFRVEIGGIRVHFGAGALDLVGSVARELGGLRVLVVTDPGVRAAGHAGRAVAFLEREGLEAELFDGAEENPTSLTVEAGRSFAAEFGPDLLVAVGGGSALDTVKGINFVLTNGGRMEDYQGMGKAARPMLPSIGVPTTAGTGSEAQSYAIITHPETHQKMACGDRKARFGAVLLDPELVASTPRPAAAAAGIDAVSHAVESYVTTRGNPVSRMLAREAWRLLDASLPAYLAGPGDRRAAADTLLGAHLAGAAIEASMLGAAHACANPLSAHYGLAHGIAIGLMLPPVVRFNASAVGDLYLELDRHLPERLEGVRALSGLPVCLLDVGVEESHLPELAQEAAGQWTARFNPRPVTSADLLDIYRAAWQGSER